MLNLLKKIIGKHAKAKITVRSTIDSLGALILSRMVQSSGLAGLVDAIHSRRETVIELEGSRAEIKKMIELLKYPNDIFTTQVIGVRWFPYDGQFNGFKILS